jgi:hypothetical protein
MERCFNIVVYVVGGAEIATCCSWTVGKGKIYIEDSVSWKFPSVIGSPENGSFKFLEGRQKMLKLGYPYRVCFPASFVATSSSLTNLRYIAIDACQVMYRAIIGPFSPRFSY